MTLDQAIKIQSTIDGRAIAVDTLEFLDQTHYSRSKEEWIRFGDMHLDHFFRVFQNEASHITKNDIKSLIKEVMEEK